MSKARRNRNNDELISVFVYVNDNGEFKHELFPDGIVCGVFEWEDNQDFCVSLSGFMRDDDDDDDFLNI